MKTTHDQKIKLGESGELLVASRLLAHGLVAGQLPRGYQADDLYVERGGEVVHIQVKTRVGPLSWPTGEVVSRLNRFYALVRYKNLESSSLISPTVYLVPSEIVARAVNLHRRYYLLAYPSQTGKGVPSVSDRWRMGEEMSNHGFPSGWLKAYWEPWDEFVSGKLT